MSLQASINVRKHSAMRLAARLVMFELADRADEDGFAWPGIEQIAADCLLDRSTVLRALDEAEAAGELLIFSRVGRGNRYIITCGRSADKVAIGATKRCPASDGWTPRPGSAATLARLRSEAAADPSQDATGTRRNLRPHPSQDATPPVAGCDGTRRKLRPEPVKEPTSEPSSEPAAFARAREAAPAAAAGNNLRGGSRTARPRDPLNAPEGVDAESWINACHAADLIERCDLMNVKTAGHRQPKRALAIAYLAEQLETKGYESWSIILPALAAANETEDGEVLKKMADLHRWEDGAFADAKNVKVEYSRIVLIARRLATLGGTSDEDTKRAMRRGAGGFVRCSGGLQPKATATQQSLLDRVG